MDRKGVIGLIVVVALFGAWNFFYIRKSQEAAVAKKQYEELVAAQEAAKPKPEPAPVEASTAAAAPALPGTTAPTATPALEAPVAEKLETVSTPSVEYAFS